METNRPSWDNYFMGIAHHASLRSHDKETKVGCVIIMDKKIIGVGYNGFCSGVNDSELPSTRPEKYPFMVHAEQNAISNMVLKPQSAIAYVTKMPCGTCAKLLWQNNIREWIVPNTNAYSHGCKDDPSLQELYKMLHNHGLIRREIDVDLSYLKQLTTTE